MPKAEQHPEMRAPENAHLYPVGRSEAALSQIRSVEIHCRIGHQLNYVAASD
jgi:hypothetical protein